MLKTNLSIFFTVLFMATIIAPSVLVLVDDVTRFFLQLSITYIVHALSDETGSRRDKWARILFVIDIQDLLELLLY